MRTWLKKKPDPLTERARQLNHRIAALELEIQKLSAQDDAHQDTSDPPVPGRLFRSSAHPGRAAAANPAATTFPPKPEEPVFVEVNHGRLKSRADLESSPEHFNELGVRKYDLPGFFRRLRNHLRGPTTSNPKLVSYLAAGSIQGLRPLRYEKRVARNRFILLVAGLFLLLLGIVSIFMRNY